MYNALRLNYNLDILCVKAKQPLCLDYLETLVDHGSRIYGYLSSHGPVWMLECILKPYILHLLSGPSSERAPGCCYYYPAYLSLIFARQALKYGAVLAVHRKYPYVLFFCKRHYYVPCRYEGLLVCQSYVLARVYRRYGRPEPHHSDHSRNDSIRRWMLRRLNKSVHSPEDLYSGSFQLFSEFFSILFLCNAHHFRRKLPCLLLQELYV